MMKTSKAAQTGKYESTLCGCCQDCGVCFIAWYFYPFAEGLVWAETRGEVCTCCHYRFCGNGMFIRANVRHARGMELNYCKDCMTYSFCWRCALMQDWREIKLIASQNLADASTENQTEAIIYAPPPPPDYQNTNQYPVSGYPNQYQDHNQYQNQYPNQYQDSNPYQVPNQYPNQYPDPNQNPNNNAYIGQNQYPNANQYQDPNQSPNVQYPYSNNNPNPCDPTVVDETKNDDQ